MPNADGHRPDPDALLRRVQRAEAASGRGHLRIYFGASAGVGKTYAMLAAAREARRNGRDVVVGLVETHGRSETAALLEGFEVLARQTTRYRDRDFLEFDLDAALARRPSLLLVDELAHSNVEGSRHPKRWQDVEELLAAGIDVWSTLNVQHIESLNDVVGGITGIRVQETLPDRVLDEADEVVLVDLPPDELLARLKAGKVYIPQQAERAADHFFRRGNLMALREIALRRTAERVEDDVQNYRAEKSIAPVWKTEGGILAAVGPSPGTEHVVRAAAHLAGQINTSWHAVYVETAGLQRLPEAERERILRILKLAEELGAETAALNGRDAATVLVQYAREHNLAKIVVGHDTRPRHWPWLRRVGDRLATLAPDLDLLQVGRPESMRSAARAKVRLEDRDASDDAERRRMDRRYLWAALVCGGTTLLAAPLIPFFEVVNIAMLFLLVVLLVAVRFGRGPAMVSAVLLVASLDFFFVPPRYTFASEDPEYFITFIVMLVVGLITGHLTSGLRYQARVAASRENRVRTLFEFAKDLSSALQTEQVLDRGRAVLERTVGGEVVFLLPDAAGRLVLPDNVPIPPGLDLGTAHWAFDNEQQAGLATDTLAASPFRYVPLRAPMRVRGVLAVKPERRRWLLVPEQQRQLETLARLVAMALERVHFVEVARGMYVNMESERLRNSLLAALSHDLRTPLTALVGMAESLEVGKPALSPEQSELAREIHEATLRMSRLVNNLLEMARLQSGEIKLRKEWNSIEEIVGAAIRSLGTLVTGGRVRVMVPRDLPLVECDAVLIERVFANLLENAAKYAASEAPMEVSADIEGRMVRISVADRGHGLTVGQEETIFDVFARGESHSTLPGVGLGLTISRAIVEAHGGSIRARNRDGGGAVFSFTLPLGSPPEMDPNMENATANPEGR